VSQRESFCFNFFHTKIRGPKFCHNGNPFVLIFFTLKLGDLNFVTRGAAVALRLDTHGEMTVFAAAHPRLIQIRRSSTAKSWLRYQTTTCRAHAVDMASSNHLCNIKASREVCRRRPSVRTFATPSSLPKRTPTISQPYDYKRLRR